MPPKRTKSETSANTAREIQYDRAYVEGLQHELERSQRRVADLEDVAALMDGSQDMPAISEDMVTVDEIILHEELADLKEKLANAQAQCDRYKKVLCDFRERVLLIKHHYERIREENIRMKAQIRELEARSSDSSPFSLPLPATPLSSVPQTYTWQISEREKQGYQESAVIPVKKARLE